MTQRCGRLHDSVGSTWGSTIGSSTIGIPFSFPRRQKGGSRDFEAHATFVAPCSDLGSGGRTRVSFGSSLRAIVGPV